MPQSSSRAPGQYVTASSVSVPPALSITDDTGAVWMLGFRRGRRDRDPRGEYAFNVLRNGRETGELASRIESHHGRVRVFTATGWKWYTGRGFV